MRPKPGASAASGIRGAYETLGVQAFYAAHGCDSGCGRAECGNASLLAALAVTMWQCAVLLLHISSPSWWTPGPTCLPQARVRKPP